MSLYQKVSVQIEFNYISQLHRIVNNFEGIIDNSEYGNYAKFSLLLKPKDADKFSMELKNISNGTASLEKHQSFTYIKS